MEVLRLDKERWELIDNGRKPTKVKFLVFPICESTDFCFPLEKMNCAAPLTVIC